MKIAIRSVPFSAEQMGALRSLAARHGWEVVESPTGPNTPVASFADCRVLMGFFPPVLLKEVRDLRWLQLPSAGVERYCGDLYARDDVVLTNAANAYGASIAEYLLAGLLMLFRRMPAYFDNQRARIWRPERAAKAVRGSTVCVVGLGDLGGNFARRVKALGANVRGVRRTAGEKPDYVDELFTGDALSQAVAGADAVALCLPATAQTENMVSGEVLAAMRPDAILLNAGRGHSVDEDALIEALSAGKLGGAVLDVAKAEPLSQQSPLWGMQNVVLTPHISAYDEDADNQRAVFSIFHENLRRYLEGEPLLHVVDRARGY